jgi:hypothetical protein
VEHPLLDCANTLLAKATPEGDGVVVVVVRRDHHPEKQLMLTSSWCLMDALCVPLVTSWRKKEAAQSPFSLMPSSASSSGLSRISDWKAVPVTLL